MTILLTLYLAGMPLAAVVLAWAFHGVPADEDDGLLTSRAGLATAALFILLWPVFLVVWLRDIWMEGSE
jgi:hypothetical protein